MIVSGGGRGSVKTLVNVSDGRRVVVKIEISVIVERRPVTVIDRSTVEMLGRTKVTVLAAADGISEKTVEVRMLVNVKIPDGFEMVGVIVIVTVEGGCRGRVGNSVVNVWVREIVMVFPSKEMSCVLTLVIVSKPGEGAATV